MNLHECILTQNDCFKAGKTIEPKGVMVHSTGANNPNLKRYVQPDDGLLGKNQYDNDWNRPGLDVCVHAFIGKLADGSIATYQTLPWNMRAWHCGRSGNNTHISFEICEDDLTNDAYFAAVYQEAVELTAYLCRTYGLDPMADGVVLDHAEGNALGIASGHHDVENWFPRHGKTMDDFRAAVASALQEEATDMTKEEIESLVEAETKRQLDARLSLAGSNSRHEAFAQDAIAWALALGLVEGDGKGNYGYQQPLTLERFLTILYRYTNRLGDTSEKQTSTPEQDLS